MAVDGVSSNFDVTPSEYTEGKAKVSSLGKDEFLNLLVTQLQYQDPLEPSNDTEFIAQMAQFSSLEQMQNLNNTFSSFMSYSLVGKYATAEYGTGSIEGYIESIVKFHITKHVRKVAGLWRSDIYQQLISPGDILSWLDNGLLTV